MSLDIGSGSGRPYVKYNAKAGRWYVRGDNGEDAEIDTPTFVIDFANIASGWFLFRENQAPDRTIDPAMGTRAAQPTPEHKRGFVVMCNSPTVLRRHGRNVQFVDAPVQCHQRRLRAVPGGQGCQSWACSRLRLYRNRAVQGQVRHELQADVAADEVGRPARRPAGRAGGAGSAQAGSCVATAYRRPNPERQLPISVRLSSKNQRARNYLE